MVQLSNCTSVLSVSPQHLCSRELGLVKLDWARLGPCMRNLWPRLGIEEGERSLNDEYANKYLTGPLHVWELARRVRVAGMSEGCQLCECVGGGLFQRRPPNTPPFPSTSFTPAPHTHPVLSPCTQHLPAYRQ